MTPEMTDALKAGIQAMRELQAMVEGIDALVTEVTGIINEGRRQLAVYDCLEVFRKTA